MKRNRAQTSSSVVQLISGLRERGTTAPRLLSRPLYQCYPLLFGLAASALTGCGTAPFDAPVDERGRPTVSQVVDRVDCEVYKAFNDPANSGIAKDPNYQNWVAAVTLSLTVNDTEGVTPTGGLALSFVEPLKLAGSTFGFGASPILYQTRSRIYQQNYTINNVFLIDKNVCLKSWHEGFNLEGNLGLADQIYAGLHSVDAGNAFDYKNPINTFSATVSFQVYKGVSGVGPTWTLVRFKDTAGGLGISRNDLHSVSITFKPANKATASFLAPEVSDAVTAAETQNTYLVQSQLLNAITQSLNRP
jgi:hypothetical protein